MDSRTKQDFTRRITQSNRSELVVVLYDICFSYFDEAEKNLKEKDFDVYKEAIRKADAVIGELQAALNFQYELSPQLYPLYSYCRRELMRSMYQQSGDGIAHAKRVLSGLYQAFCEVAKQDTSEPLMHNTQQVYAGMTYGKEQLNENFQDFDTSRGFFA